VNALDQSELDRLRDEVADLRPFRSALRERDSLIAELAAVLRSVDRPVSPDGIVTHYCPFCGGNRWAEGQLNHAADCAQQAVLARVPAP